MQKVSMSLATVAAGLVLVVGVLTPDGTFAAQDQTGQKTDERARRPEFRLRARPNTVVSPGRVVLTAELVGGADDFEQYYCPTVEWDWGDGTRSESTADCDPYVAGQSEIRRRFTVEHVFRLAGRMRVYIRLKQRDDEVAAASANIDVREGAPQW